MLPSPFLSEIPYGLGDDTAWLGREVMQALQLLRRHQYTDINPGAPNDAHIHTPHLTASSNPTIHPRDRRAEGAACRGRLEHA